MIDSLTEITTHTMLHLLGFHDPRAHQLHQQLPIKRLTEFKEGWSKLAQQFIRQPDTQYKWCLLLVILILSG